jgi:hypothetical protein
MASPVGTNPQKKNGPGFVRGLLEKLLAWIARGHAENPCRS